MIDPDATLVVIAYREHERAPEAVRSILDQQGSASFEVILVDDGSDDGTADAVAGVAAGDARLRIIRLERNAGRGAARAAGIAAARGQVIGFVDADIVLPSDWLARCLAALPGHAAVGGIAVPDGDAAVVARIAGVRARVVRGSRAITGNNVLFDGQILRATGFEPTARMGEDFRLASELERAGHHLATVPGLFVEHREGKSYGAMLHWFYASGFDATALLLRFRIVRVPDLAHAAWLAAWAFAIVGSVLLSPVALAFIPLVTAAIGLTHAGSRFAVRPSPVRFALAAALDTVGISLYLVGRTFGLVHVAAGRR